MTKLLQNYDGIERCCLHIELRIVIIPIDIEIRDSQVDYKSGFQTM